MLGHSHWYEAVDEWYYLANINLIHETSDLILARYFGNPYWCGFDFVNSVLKIESIQLETLTNNENKEPSLEQKVLKRIKATMNFGIDHSDGRKLKDIANEPKSAPASVSPKVDHKRPKKDRPNM